MVSINSKLNGRIFYNHVGETETKLNTVHALTHLISERRKQLTYST